MSWLCFGVLLLDFDYYTMLSSTSDEDCGFYEESLWSNYLAIFYFNFSISRSALSSYSVLFFTLLMLSFDLLFYSF